MFPLQWVFYLEGQLLGLPERRIVITSQSLRDTGHLQDLRGETRRITNGPCSPLVPSIRSHRMTRYEPLKSLSRVEFAKFAGPEN